jgi:hypothetical protein
VQRVHRVRERTLRHKMSSTVWFANRRYSCGGIHARPCADLLVTLTCVESPGSFNTARITCSIGVIPVPPAIMPTRLQVRSFSPPPCDASCFTANTPRFLYVKRPFGP